MKQKEKIRIFDTTLRDGQQCPGAGLRPHQNFEYARLAKELGIDVLEAGFPSAGKSDFEIVRTISDEIADVNSPMIIAGLCQLRDEQIDITMEALLPARDKGRALLHTYVPVSPALMEASLGEKADKSRIVDNVHRFILRAVSSGYEVEFSPEGYSRQGDNFDFVTDLVLAAVDAGASVINCPDTIGGSFQYEGENYFVNQMMKHASIVSEKFPDRNIIWSAHCHNDFGLAVHNSVNSVFGGPARQIEGCINGVGERAGNAALESVIMIISEFGSLPGLAHEFYTDIDISKLSMISDFVARFMLPRQPHWPVTGENAAKHSSGGHTNAVLQNPLAYQPFDPRQTGKNISIVFGPLSGGNHAQAIIRDSGYICENHEKAAIAQFIKSMFSERRKGITDEELLQGYVAFRAPVRIDSYDYSRSSTKVELVIHGNVFDQSGVIRETYEGRDSALAALKKLVDRYFSSSIISHRSESDREGIEAESISRIRIIAEGKEFEGIGRDSDIEVSALKAFVDAVNQAYVMEKFTNKQNQGDSLSG
jgi:2-isopropylmalate synthase